MLTRCSSSSLLSGWPLRAASLLAFAVGALVLMADSASCTDGYPTTSFDATFHSTCPAAFGPADGTVHLAVANDKGRELLAALQASGLHAENAEVRASKSDECTSSSFTFSLKATSSLPNLTCAGVKLDVDANRIACTSGSLTPLVLQVGRRDLEGGSSGDAATDADATSDGGPGETNCIIEFTRVAKP